MIHAAGRQTYRKGDSWAALASPAPGFEPSPACDLVPLRVTVDRNLNTNMKLSGVMGNFKVFRIPDRDHYEKALSSSLRRLLAEMRLATTIS